MILMGSANDAPIMHAAVDVLKELGISVEMHVASAHRSPERVLRLIDEAGKRGVDVFIIGAGAAAHLAGVVAAHVIKPVIGVPIDSSALKGLDALFEEVAEVARIEEPRAVPEEQDVRIFIARKPRAPIATVWPSLGPRWG